MKTSAIHLGLAVGP